MQLTDDSPRKVRTWSRQCVVMPDELKGRAHAVAAALGLRLSHLAAMGLEQVVRQLEDENGGPFPSRQGKLPKGRPTDVSRRAAGLIRE
jgi:hypothetical protein